MLKLDHIAINVDSIHLSVDWYVRNHQAKVLYEDLTWAMLEVFGTKIALTVPNEHPAHIAFRVDSPNDFPAGSEIKMHRDGSYYTYMSDTNGNTIEYIYWPKDSEETKEKAATH